ERVIIVELYVDISDAVTISIVAEVNDVFDIILIHVVSIGEVLDHLIFVLIDVAEGETIPVTIFEVYGHVGIITEELHIDLIDIIIVTTTVDRIDNVFKGCRRDTEFAREQDRYFAVGAGVERETLNIAI